MAKEDEDHDFGFTFDDYNPETDGGWDVKFQELKKMIMPLLKNLAKNPEKSTIVWPNRQERISKFISDIDKLEKR